MDTIKLIKLKIPTLKQLKCGIEANLLFEVFPFSDTRFWICSCLVQYSNAITTIMTAVTFTKYTENAASVDINRFLK